MNFFKVGRNGKSSNRTKRRAWSDATRALKKVMFRPCKERRLGQAAGLHGKRKKSGCVLWKTVGGKKKTRLQEMETLYRTQFRAVQN